MPLHTAAQCGGSELGPSLGGAMGHLLLTALAGCDGCPAPRVKGGKGKSGAVLGQSTATIN